MSVAGNVRDVFRTSVPKVVMRHPEWLVDAVVGPSIDPSRAVIVSGFWRSGTSILLEVLCRASRSKAVFEPFRAGNVTYDELLRRRGTEVHYITEPFMPFWGGDWDAFCRYVRQALTGATPGVFVRASRRSIRKREGRSPSSIAATVAVRVRDALRRRVVVKSVRAHLVLPHVAQVFSPRGIVHIRRDPRAIVASLERKGWNWFGDVSLTDLLLRPDDGRRDVFNPFADEIARIDEEGGIAKCAAYWALMENHLRQSKIPGRLTLNYEELCRHGIDYIEDQLGKLSELNFEADYLSGGSASTQRGRESISAEERIAGWKNILSREEVRKVEGAVATFGMEDFLREL